MHTLNPALDIRILNSSMKRFSARRDALTATDLLFFFSKIRNIFSDSLVMGHIEEQPFCQSIRYLHLHGEERAKDHRQLNRQELANSPR